MNTTHRVEVLRGRLNDNLLIREEFRRGQFELLSDIRNEQTEIESKEAELEVAGDTASLKALQVRKGELSVQTEAIKKFIDASIKTVDKHIETLDDAIKSITK